MEGVRTSDPDTEHDQAVVPTSQKRKSVGGTRRDSIRRVRPSQMPDASGHSIGNANVVKAEALFAFLRDVLLPQIEGGRAGAILRGPASDSARRAPQ